MAARASPNVSPNVFWQATGYGEDVSDLWLEGSGLTA